MYYVFFVAPLPLVVFHVVIESVTSITVSWDPPLKSYVSYYSITITGGGQIHTMNTTSTSVQWSQLQTNVHYNVSISAVNPRGASTVTVQVTSLLEGKECMVMRLTTTAKQSGLSQYLSRDMTHFLSTL